MEVAVQDTNILNRVFCNFVKCSVVNNWWKCQLKYSTSVPVINCITVKTSNALTWIKGLRNRWQLYDSVKRHWQLWHVLVMWNVFAVSERISLLLFSVNLPRAIQWLLSPNMPVGWWWDVGYNTGSNSEQELLSLLWQNFISSIAHCCFCIF